jgi:hypothetical protein
MSLNYHNPGRPKKPVPKKLEELAATLYHPEVVRTGLTTTENGDWALLVVVKAGSSIPIPEIEKKSSGFPVIYEENKGNMPVARPAYPLAGE